jgi:hypothetical protein
MKVVSQEMLAELVKQQVTHVFCFAAKIIHPQLTGGVPYRIINDTVKHTIKEADNVDYEYEAIPFEVTLPVYEEDAPPTVECTIANVGGELIDIIRNTRTSPYIELYIVRIDTNGDAFLEIGPMYFVVTNVAWDDNSISLTLGFEYQYLNEPSMIWSFTPDIARGLFE